jgi:hypothetical protein
MGRVGGREGRREGGRKGGKEHLDVACENGLTMEVEGKGTKKCLRGRTDVAVAVRGGREAGRERGEGEGGGGERAPALHALSGCQSVALAGDGQERAGEREGGRKGGRGGEHVGVDGSEVSLEEGEEGCPRLFALREVGGQGAGGNKKGKELGRGERREAGRVGRGGGRGGRGGASGDDNAVRRQAVDVD